MPPKERAKIAHGVNALAPSVPVTGKAVGVGSNGAAGFWGTRGCPTPTVVVGREGKEVVVGDVSGCKVVLVEEGSTVVVVTVVSVGTVVVVVSPGTLDVVLVEVVVG